MGSHENLLAKDGSPDSCPKGWLSSSGIHIHPNGQVSLYSTYMVICPSSVRTSGEILIIELLDSFEEDAASALGAAAQRRLQEAVAAKVRQIFELKPSPSIVIFSSHVRACLVMAP